MKRKQKKCPVELPIQKRNEKNNYHRFQNRKKQTNKKTGKIIIFLNKYLQILPVQKYLLFSCFLCLNSLYMATESSVLLICLNVSIYKNKRFFSFAFKVIVNAADGKTCPEISPFFLFPLYSTVSYMESSVSIDLCSSHCHTMSLYIKK